jgi:hypothetical protein
VRAGMSRRGVVHGRPPTRAAEGPRPGAAPGLGAARELGAAPGLGVGLGAARELGAAGGAW